MYFFEALKNYGKLKEAFEASKDSALAYRKMENAIKDNPKHAVVIDGKYVLMGKSAYLLLVEEKYSQAMTNRDAADALIGMYRECLVSGGDTSPADIRALTMAIGALCSPAMDLSCSGVDVEALEKEAEQLGDDWPEINTSDGENDTPEESQEDKSTEEKPRPSGRIEFVRS